MADRVVFAADSRGSERVVDSRRGIATAVVVVGAAVALQFVVVVDCFESMAVAVDLVLVRHDMEHCLPAVGRLWVAE